MAAAAPFMRPPQEVASWPSARASATTGCGAIIAAMRELAGPSRATALLRRRRKGKPPAPLAMLSDYCHEPPVKSFVNEMWVLRSRVGMSSQAPAAIDARPFRSGAYRLETHTTKAVAWEENGAFEE